MNEYKEESICYRDSIYQIPILEHYPVEIQEISDRLNTGLMDLISSSDIAKIEYAGFVFDSYFTEGTGLEMDGEFVEELQSALMKSGLGSVDKLSLRSTQDIFPSGSDCFDWIRLQQNIWRRNISYMREGSMGKFEDGLKIVYPAIRRYEPGKIFERNDEYGQRTDLDVNFAGGVIMRGNVVLDIIRESYPHIDIPLPSGEIPDIHETTIVHAISSYLNLREIDTSYEDWQWDVFKKFGFGSVFTEDGMVVLPNPNRL